MPEGGHGCRGACIGYDVIQSMSGRYASYWNAFLFSIIFYRELHKNEINWNEGGGTLPWGPPTDPLTKIIVVFFLLFCIRCVKLDELAVFN